MIQANQYDDKSWILRYQDFASKVEISLDL